MAIKIKINKQEKSLVSIQILILTYISQLSKRQNFINRKRQAKIFILRIKTMQLQQLPIPLHSLPVKVQKKLTIYNLELLVRWVIWLAAQFRSVTSMLNLILRANLSRANLSKPMKEVVDLEINMIHN